VSEARLIGWERRRLTTPGAGQRVVDYIHMPVCDRGKSQQHTCTWAVLP